MKDQICILAVIILTVAAAFGQKVSPVSTAVKKAVETFEREKFDPLRDPKLDLEKAVEKTIKSGKRIILDVGGEWCGWCVFMDKFFVQNPEFARLRDQNFVWVKVNYSEENENSEFLGLYPAASGYPHLYVLDESGKFLHSQDTAPLESGKGYDLAKFSEFLNTWSVKKPALLK